MAEWWMEGCVKLLLDIDDPLTQQLLERCDINLIPNMNPDGSRRGHLRTNAAGRNLNREWIEPTMDSAPEVHLAKQAMAETGVDFFLDVHGDEALPYCFIAGTEGLANWESTRQSKLDFYCNRLAHLNPDFQTKYGYPAKRPGEANLSMSTAQTASLYDCLAMTLEMPFKDTTATPDSTYGWSPKRSGKLAESCLQAMLDYIQSDHML
jgi:murein tripeptide amidase MpaA